jgi:hypothetical protein
MGIQLAPRTFARTNRFLGRCLDCVLPIAREIEHQGNFQRVRCPGCGKEVQLERVSAKVDEMVPCDPSCMMATGPDCECACGGENHGCSWLDVTFGELSVAVQMDLTSYRQKIERLRAPRKKYSNA